MIPMLSWLLLTVALAQTPSGEPAAAGQTPPAQRPAARANRGIGLTNNELVNMLDTYAIVQAQDALQLGDPQYGQFVTRLKRLQEMRRKNTQARNRIVAELRRLTLPDTPLDENTIRERLKALREHDERAAADLRRAYDSVDEVLDARQQARFRIFEEQMERKKLDLLMRARNRAAVPAEPKPRR